MSDIKMQDFEYYQQNVKVWMLHTHIHSRTHIAEICVQEI